MWLTVISSAKPAEHATHRWKVLGQTASQGGAHTVSALQNWLRHAKHVSVHGRVSASRRPGWRGGSSLLSPHSASFTANSAPSRPPAESAIACSKRIVQSVLLTSAIPSDKHWLLIEASFDVCKARCSKQNKRACCTPRAARACPNFRQGKSGWLRPQRRPRLPVLPTRTLQPGSPPTHPLTMQAKQMGVSEMKRQCQQGNMGAASALDSTVLLVSFSNTCPSTSHRIPKPASHFTRTWRRALLYCSCGVQA